MDDTTELVFVVGTFGEKQEKEGDHGTAGTAGSVRIRPQDCLFPLRMYHRSAAVFRKGPGLWGDVPVKRQGLG